MPTPDFSDATRRAAATRRTTDRAGERATEKQRDLAVADATSRRRRVAMTSASLTRARAQGNDDIVSLSLSRTNPRRVTERSRAARAVPGRSTPSDLTSVSLPSRLAVVLTKKKPTGGMNGVPKSADAVRLVPRL